MISTAKHLLNILKRVNLRNNLFISTKLEANARIRPVKITTAFCSKELV